MEDQTYAEPQEKESSSPKKRKRELKRQRDRQTQITRVNIGVAFPRWKELMKEKDFKGTLKLPAFSSTETKPVRTDAVAGEETETWPPFKVTTVCLGLLCLLLLTTVIGLGAVYDRDFKQLSRDLANHTAEKDQLLVRYQNLTDERDQLQTIHELNNKLGTCPHGWRQFGCSCYYLYTRKSTWANSKQTCLSQGADLVIIDSQEEMVFLNKLGARLKFWIGLSQSSTHRYLSTWAWANGRSLVTSYWQNDRLSYDYYGGGQCCAAFNSFNSNWRIKSWSSEVCSQVLQWVCEKQAQMSFLS